MKAIPSRVVLAATVACIVLCLTGCSIYLHDDGLQKKTGNALSIYKAANVSASIKAALDAQTQIDQQMLNNVIIEDGALRDADFARLLYGDPLTSAVVPPEGRKSSPADLLLEEIQFRLSILGAGYQFDLGNWRKYLSDFGKAQTRVDHQSVIISAYANRFASQGGAGFSTCGEDIALPTDGNGAASGGLLGKLSSDIASVQKTIAEDRSAAKSVSKALADAKGKVDTDTKGSTTVDAKVNSVFTTFSSDVATADKVVGALGASNYKPSAALAAIQFRKTNLCDVIAASAGQSCTGGQVGAKPSAAAAALNQSIVGLLSGVEKVTSLDSPPSTAVLSIALAYQTSLEGGAQASLNAMLQRQALLQHEQSAAVLEVEFLLEARDLLTRNEAALSSAACRPPVAKAPKASSVEAADKKAGGAKVLGPTAEAATQVVTLGDVLTVKDCSARKAVADALTGYMFSWTRGQMAERIDETKLSQLMVTLNLQITQANAVARDTVITNALTELDAFGQGGVDAKTIAAFLQAVGIVAIAKGVN